MVHKILPIDSDETSGSDLLSPLEYLGDKSIEHGLQDRYILKLFLQRGQESLS